jgi:hypothetical protein
MGYLGCYLGLDMWEIEQIAWHVGNIGCALAIALCFVILMSQPLAFRVSMIIMSSSIMVTIELVNHHKLRSTLLILINFIQTFLAKCDSRQQFL